MRLQLGFSTGCLHKCGLTLKEQLVTIAEAECRAVEINCLRMDFFESEELRTLTADDIAEHDFQYISIHSPKSEYGPNDETKKMLDGLHRLNRELLANLVAIHPDQVADMRILNQAGFHVGLENMDNRKAVYRTPKEFEPVFAEHPGWSLVLDVNHIYSNDMSMGLAVEFYQKFGPRITQIHLSGYAGYHEPLFRTLQPQIIRSIQNLDIPIVVESVFEKPDDMKRERDYILKVLGSQ